MSKQNILIFCIALVLTSCTKIDVTFGNENQEGDPNLSYVDDYPVDIATYKIDSFITSSHSVFTIGHHIDPDFGSVTAGSYCEVSLPSENPVRDQTVTFDSLVVILKTNGNYYGDTLVPFKINVHRLDQKIENEENTNFYNPRRFQFDPVPLGQTTVYVKPKKGTTIKIRLADSFGKDLLTKFRNNNDVIQGQSVFLDYFKGLYIGPDTVFDKAMNSFVPDSTGMILRLHYKLNGTILQEKYFDLPFNSAKQYNQISYDHTGTNLAVFTPFKKQLKASSVTGHKAYLHSNVGSYIKISFPSILNIKELHPYVKVMKAELVISSSPGTAHYPYSLPSSLNLYTTDENNVLNAILADNDGQALTGNLYVDALYGEQTHYTFDITDFITKVINEGSFSKSALMLTPASVISDSQFERLVLNDQTLSKGIQLKLYVLGL